MKLQRNPLETNSFQLIPCPKLILFSSIHSVLFIHFFVTGSHSMLFTHFCVIRISSKTNFTFCTLLCIYYFLRQIPVRFLKQTFVRD